MMTGRPRRTGQALPKRRHEQIARLFLGLDHPASYSLDDGLRARCRAKLDPGVVKVEINRPLGDSELFCDFGRSLTSRHRGEHFNLTTVELHELRPHFGARDAGQPRVDDGSENVEIDRLPDVIVRTELSPLELIFSAGLSGHEHKRHASEARGDVDQSLQSSNPDMIGRSISHNTRSGFSFRIAKSPS